jgi:hypothetical protein
MSGAVMPAAIGLPDDNSLELMLEMQRDYLRRGGTSMPAVLKMGRSPYVHQDYPKTVWVAGKAIGIAPDLPGETNMLEAHLRATGGALDTARADNAALAERARLLSIIGEWTPDQFAAALAAVQEATPPGEAPGAGQEAPPPKSTPEPPPTVSWDDPKPSRTPPK